MGKLFFGSTFIKQFAPLFGLDPNRVLNMVIKADWDGIVQVEALFNAPGPDGEDGNEDRDSDE